MIEGEGRLVAVSEPSATGDFALGERVFHVKFGYGRVLAIEGNKLTVDFEKAGEKKVIELVRGENLSSPAGLLELATENTESTDGIKAFTPEPSSPGDSPGDPCRRRLEWPRLARPWPLRGPDGRDCRSAMTGWRGFACSSVISVFSVVQI